MANNWDSVSDRSYGFGHTTDATQTVTASTDSNGSVTTASIKTGDVGSGTVNRYSAPDMFKGIAADGAFDRSWGWGQIAGAAQSAKFSSNTSNYTTDADTDTGTTAPTYLHTAPAQDFSSIADRSSGWGHTNGAGGHVLVNGVSTLIPTMHD